MLVLEVHLREVRADALVVVARRHLVALDSVLELDELLVLLLDGLLHDLDRLHGLLFQRAGLRALVERTEHVAQDGVVVVREEDAVHELHLVLFGHEAGEGDEFLAGDLLLHVLGRSLDHPERHVAVTHEAEDRLADGLEGVAEVGEVVADGLLHRALVVEHLGRGQVRGRPRR